MKYELSKYIQNKMLDKNLILRKATINDLDNILDLFTERIKWFKNNNIDQWSKYLEHHPKSEFEDVILNSNLFLLQNNSDIIATFELTTNSKYWFDTKTPAYYIYKVVIKHGYKQMGELIFDICIDIAKQNNKKYLRLSCLNSNTKLNDIYENHGFKFIKLGYDEYYTYSLRQQDIN